MTLCIAFKREHPNAVIPTYKTKGAAGADVCSVEEKTIPPGERAFISLGFSVSIPEGLEIQVRPRSGLALKNGITVLNTPGTLDSDFRGLVGVVLFNSSKEPFVVLPGDRIAQMVVNKVELLPFIEVDELDSTERGTGGFGSTGVR